LNKEKVKSNVCLICDRPTYEKSEYCIFHAKPEEKKEEEFKQALKAYFKRIKTKKIDYDFEKFIFIGDIDFVLDFEINVFCKCSFKEAEFLGGTISFNNIEFIKDPKFINTKFLSGSINFKNVKFDEKTSFLGVLFYGRVDFSNAFFSKEVEFKGTKFEGGSTSFKKVIFCNDVSFEGNNFQNSIDFNNAVFKGNFKCSFDKFNGSELNFNCANINKKFEIAVSKNVHVSLNFESITTCPGFTDITLMILNGGISFRNTLLEKISLCFEIYNDLYIDFEGARIRDTVLRRDHIEGHLIQENRKIYSKAKEIYIALKNNFRIIGRYDDESWAFKKEKDMERKSYFHFKSLHKWLWSYFLNAIFGYGEKPDRVILSAMITILIFTFLFMIFGISNTSIGVFTLKNFKDCIIFSFITFGTLRYGDLRPLESWSRIFAGAEAFIGAFIIALLVYTFIRKAGGR